MDSETAPGPDSFSEVFYRNFWNIITSNLLVVVRPFFRSDWVPPSVSSIIISLIPKKENLINFLDLDLLAFVISFENLY